MPQPSKPTFARSEGVYPTTIAGRQQPNMGGYISTTGYRNTSNTSTSSSTSSIHRPGSRVNGNKHGSSRHTNGRPPSAVDMQQAAEEEAEVEAGIMGKRKGTPLMSFLSAGGLHLRKVRTAHDLRGQQQPRESTSSRSQQSGSYVRSLSASTCSSSNNTTADSKDCNGTGSAQDGSRSTSTSSLGTPSQQGARSSSNSTVQSRHPSLVKAFAELTIAPKPSNVHKPLPPKPPSSHTKHRPSLSPVKEITSPSKIPKFSCTPTLKHAASAQALLNSPSPLKSKHSTNGLRTPAPSAVKRNAHSSSLIRNYTSFANDGIPVYLTKEKLTPSSLPAWDTKGRLEDMEQLYSKLRNEVASAADTKRGFEEQMEFYKAQGEYSRIRKEDRITLRY